MVDFRAILVLILFFLLAFLLWNWARLFHSPHVKFSSLAPFSKASKTLKQRWFNLPKYLMISALFFFCLAFIDPHDFVEKTKKEEQQPIKQTIIPTEGIAIYLVLDQSGSMGGEIKAPSSSGRWTKMTKLELLKQISKDFVEGNPHSGLKGRPNDIIGLVSFARGAQVLAPLTLDHQAILDQLDKLQFVKDVNLDGTSIGYAMFKTANLIAATRHYAQELEGEGKPAYQIKNSIMIVVTDGLQAPNPLDRGKQFRNIELMEAAEYAKKEGIRIYFINVEPKIAAEEFAAHRSLMKKAAETTGGRFYLLDSSMSLDKIYADIDQLEKSTLPIETQYVTPPKEEQPQLYSRRSFYPYLIALGLLSLLLAVLLEGTMMRRIP